MKKLILSAFLLLGACSKPAPPTVCFKLDTCRAVIAGNGTVMEVTCVRGFDVDGKPTSEVHRFLDMETLRTWSVLHPDVKVCK